MSRSFTRDGVCTCCGRVGVWWSEGDPEGDPDLCDRCECAQRRWDAAQLEKRQPGHGYPYLEPPPKTPPIRR